MSNQTPAELALDFDADGQHSADGGAQYLTFMLAGEEYGVEILGVQEIKGWDRSTEIPNTPDYVLGVINLRGAVIPVIDLRRRFGMETREFTKLTVVIVVRVDTDDGEKTVGLVVDAVSDVYNIDASDVKPAPDFGTSVDTRFMKGLASVDEKMIILLEVKHIVSDA